MNLLNRIIIWVRHNKGISISAVVLIIMGVPVLIHIAYKIPAPAWLASEWSAGEMLSYYGAVLAFGGTVIFSALALWQGEQIQKANERAEEIRIEPKLRVYCHGYYGNARNMQLIFANIGSSAIYNVRAYNFQMVNADGNIQESLNQNIGPINLMSEKEVAVELKNPSFEAGEHIEFEMICENIFGKQYKYKIISVEHNNKIPGFRMVPLENN